MRAQLTSSRQANHDDDQFGAKVALGDSAIRGNLRLRETLGTVRLRVFQPYEQGSVLTGTSIVVARLRELRQRLGQRVCSRELTHILGEFGAVERGVSVRQLPDPIPEGTGSPRCAPAEPSRNI